jgi:hypothetical protein
VARFPQRKLPSMEACRQASDALVGRHETHLESRGSVIADLG